MGMSYLFDTNVVIYFLGKIVLSNNALKQLDDICAQGQHLSIITKLEVLGYRFESDKNEGATRKFISTSHIYQISPEIEIETINLRKEVKMKLPDAIIAATAIVNDFTLISANTKDFKSIQHLKLLNPFDL
jgi:predicted nucleic acid-binding protein